MVLWMLDWVTSELYAPGVQFESGNGRYAWEQVLACAGRAVTLIPATMQPAAMVTVAKLAAARPMMRNGGSGRLVQRGLLGLCS